LTEQHPDEQPELDAITADGTSESQIAGSDSVANRTSREVLYEQIGVALMNAGVVSPAAQFITDVRAAAGFRASPREVAVAAEQMAAMHEPVTVETVAEMVATLRGDRSTRQQRHADAWRTLGVQLAMRGQDGSPEGQRAFIGTAHALAGRDATDGLLLQIALLLADQGQRLDAETVGRVGKRLAASAADIAPEQLAGLVERELRALTREARRPKRPPRTVSAGNKSQAHNPGARKWRPGGRRRRKIQLPPKPKTDPFER
jgi:hypothetical protein